jgi:RNA polymerase sigma-70 factor, ECF subfamily
MLQMLFSSLLGRLATQEKNPPAESALTGAELVAEHYDFIWRLLRRMGLSEADTDDATQQVFVTTLYPELKPIRKGSERSFLYGVALNVFRELRRKHIAAMRHSPDLLENATLGSAGIPERLTTESPELALQKKQAWRQLQKILSAMTEEVRATFVLYELEGLTAPEIARLAEIPLGTVASRLRRAREQFSTELAALNEPTTGAP